ncbi:hypothetical protein DFP73DRAFT_592811 [Morchella snyderi]|nr:hypothetical protein DFP73DRAFT_592811 [Morchella snyderi]
MTLPTGLPPLSCSAITIGLKLEFLITRLPRGPASDSQREHEHERARSASTLISTALTPLCTALRIPPPHHGPIPTTTHPTFTIKHTTSAPPPPPPAASHPATTIALTTPILPYNTYARVLHATCTAITTAGASVSCSRTHPGLHVHVGLLGRRYTLDELQRLAKAIIIFEARMDAHHADGGGGGGGDGGGDYTQMQSCIGSAALRGLDVRGRLAAVDDARSYLALCAVMNTGRVVGARRAEEMSSRLYKYNFEAVGRYGTVEFRQAAGTVDAVWIEDWVERVVRFVMAAVRTEDAVFRGWAMVEGGPDDPAVLERFGIGELRESAARRRRRRRGVESAARGLGPGAGRCRLLAVPCPELPDLGPWTLPQRSTPELPVLTPSSSTLPRKPKTTTQKPIEPDTTSPDPNPKPKTSTQKPAVVRDITHPNLQVPNPKLKRNPARPQETHKTATAQHPPPSTLPDPPKAAPTSSTRPKIPIPKFKRRPFPLALLRPTKRLPTAARPSIPDPGPTREDPVMSEPDPQPDAGSAACVRGGSSSGSSVGAGGFLGVSGAGGGEVGEEGEEDEEEEAEEEEEEEEKKKKKRTKKRRRSCAPPTAATSHPHPTTNLPGGVCPPL